MQAYNNNDNSSPSLQEANVNDGVVEEAIQGACGASSCFFCGLVHPTARSRQDGLSHPPCCWSVHFYLSLACSRARLTFLVAIRFRPLIQEGTNSELHHRRAWQVNSATSSVDALEPGRRHHHHQQQPQHSKRRSKSNHHHRHPQSSSSSFTFDKTFGEECTTQQVYQESVQPIVQSVVAGWNGTIFTYGQTNSGKTFTMQGLGCDHRSPDDPSSSMGIIQLAAADIFAHIRQRPDRLFLVRASFLEIYNENVRDLLSSSTSWNHESDDSPASLPIREDEHKHVFVEAQEEIVTDMASLLDVLTRGERSRIVAATAVNERSSRSHTIFRITIESRDKEEMLSMVHRAPNDHDESKEDKENAEIVTHNDSSAASSAVMISTLNLVDLAGSESVRHTGATGKRKKEGGMINKRYVCVPEEYH